MGLDRRARGRARRWGRAAAALILLLQGGEALAAPIRLLVLAGSPQDRELAVRIKGQAADLDTTVAIAEGDLPADLEGRVAVARAAADRADVVVWFGADAGDWIVYVRQGEQVLARRIGAATGALSRSASSEAVALAVRTALTGLAASARAARDADEADREGPALRAWGELGWTGLLDGTGGTGHHGLALRAGGARGRWYLGVVLGFLPAAAVDAGPASLEVGRQHAGLLLGADLLAPAGAVGPRWSVGLELGIGAARFPRTTTATEPGLVATPDAVTWSALFSPGLRVARRLVPGGWLALELGVDLLTGPPRFEVERATGLDRLSSVWTCAPRAALSLLLDGR